MFARALRAAEAALFYGAASIFPQARHFFL
jgi:hypothetical protein